MHQVLLHTPGTVHKKAKLAMYAGLTWMHSSSAGLEHLLFPELVDSPVMLTNAKVRSCTYVHGGMLLLLLVQHSTTTISRGVLVAQGLPPGCAII